MTNDPRDQQPVSRPDNKKWWVKLILVLILLRYVVSLLYITEPIPLSLHRGNETVTASATVLRYQHGFQALEFASPLEGHIELRLHSWLTVPFLALGYPEGGRVISWLASLLSVGVLFAIGTALWDKQVGALAAFFLTVSPLFALYSYHLLPENLSVLLTCSALLLIVWSGNLTWWRITLLLSVYGVAILNHTWEVTITLPLLVVLWKRKAYGLIIPLLGLGTGLLILQVWLVTNFFSVSLDQQPHIRRGFVANHIELLLAPGWWLPIERWSRSPISLLSGAYFLLSLGGTLYLLWYVRRNPKDNAVLFLSAWFIAGLSIIFLFPGIYVGHSYATWGLFGSI